MMSDKREGKIYILRHPETKMIRYVGQTIRSLDERLSNHISQATVVFEDRNTWCFNWIRSLQKEGLEPEIRLLEYVDVGRIDEREKYWIKVFRGSGFELTNMTSGGLGFGSGSRNPNHCGLSEQHKQKISESMTGRSLSEEHCHNISQSQKGESRSEQFCSKMAKIMRGNNRSNGFSEEATQKSIELRLQSGPSSESGFKGVYEKESGNYSSYISVDGEQRYLGTYEVIEEAARAYDQAAYEEYDGDCYLNFPEEIE